MSKSITWLFKMALSFSQQDYAIIPEFVAKGRSWVMEDLFIETDLLQERWTLRNIVWKDGK